MRARGQRGQSTVELVAMLPLLFVVVYAAAQVLAAGIASEYAGHAAEAGAVALLEGGDPAVAARAAAPGWSHGALRVSVAGSTVRVAVSPPAILPGVARLLTAHAQARAGR